MKVEIVLFINDKEVCSKKVERVPLVGESIRTFGIKGITEDKEYKVNTSTTIICYRDFYVQLQLGEI